LPKRSDSWWSDWHDFKAESTEGGSDGFHALEIAEQVSAYEKIEVVGGPRHGQSDGVFLDMASRRRALGANGFGYIPVIARIPRQEYLCY